MMTENVHAVGRGSGCSSSCLLDVQGGKGIFLGEPPRFRLRSRT